MCLVAPLLVEWLIHSLASTLADYYLGHRGRATHKLNFLQKSLLEFFAEVRRGQAAYGLNSPR